MAQVSASVVEDDGVVGEWKLAPLRRARLVLRARVAAGPSRETAGVLRGLDMVDEEMKYKRDKMELFKKSPGSVAVSHVRLKTEQNAASVDMG